MTDHAFYTFYVSLHALPPEAAPGEPMEIAGRTLRPLRVAPERLAATPFACSFEEARDRLGQLGRMYCEPDGSFVWASAHGRRAWQIDGNLFDRDGRLLFVDLKGACPRKEFDDLLRAFGWPATRLMFQLTRQAVFADEAEFRRFAAGG